jgi:hypothetical protein
MIIKSKNVKRVIMYLKTFTKLSKADFSMRKLYTYFLIAIGLMLIGVILTTNCPILNGIIIGILTGLITSLGVTVGFNIVLSNQREKETIPVRKAYYLEICSNFLDAINWVFGNPTTDFNKQYFTKENIIKKISNIDFYGLAPTAPIEKMWVDYIHDKLHETCDIGNTILTRYNTFLPPELFRSIHAFLNSWEISSMLRLCSLLKLNYQKGSRDCRETGLIQEMIISKMRQSFIDNILYISEWCEQNKSLYDASIDRNSTNRIGTNNDGIYRSTRSKVNQLTVVSCK